MIVRTIGLGIVLGPFVSALLLGLGRGGRALTNRLRRQPR